MGVGEQMLPPSYNTPLLTVMVGRTVSTWEWLTSHQYVKRDTDGSLLTCHLRTLGDLGGGSLLVGEL